MTLTVSIKQCEKGNLLHLRGKAPFCVPLPVLSRCQAERAQGLYPDTTVNDIKMHKKGEMQRNLDNRDPLISLCYPIKQSHQ